MPRGRRGGSSPTRARSPVSHVPARAPPAAPAAPAAAPPAMAQPRQPGMMANIASTAAGVAIGSAVGHTIGHTMTGGGGGDEQQATAAPAAAQQLDQGGPCQLQLKQFLECSQTQHDLSLCQGFNDALRECKQSYGLSM